MTPEWLAKNFHDLLTSNMLSPDLNPLDYYIWGIVEAETNQQQLDTKSLLKTIMDHQIQAYSHFWNYIGAVLKSDSDFIE